MGVLCFCCPGWAYWRSVMVMKSFAGKAGKALKTGMAGVGMAKGRPPAVGKVAGAMGAAAGAGMARGAKPLPGVAGTAYNKGMARMQKAQKLAGAGARMSKKPV